MTIAIIDRDHIRFSEPGNPATTLVHRVSPVGERPNIEGLWQTRPRGDSGPPGWDFEVSTSGNNVTAQFLIPGTKAPVVYEGAFESKISAAGKYLDGMPDSAAPRWIPEHMTILDSNHLKFSDGRKLTRASASEATFAREIYKISLSPLPAKPFNLNGVWSLEGINLSLTQQGENVILGGMGVGSKPTFQGRYASNPVIAGQGVSDQPRDGSLHYVEKTLIVADPDHLKYGDAFLHRESIPPIRDVPCDDQNTYHVQGDYAAWIRGRMALQEKDFKTAKCWLRLGVKWGFDAAKSELAALIIQGSDGAKPDYALAFQLASDSALAGDITGQVVLASMYQNGLGTPQDTQRAQYWLKKVEQSKSAALWAQWTSKSVYGFSPLELAGAVLDVFKYDEKAWARANEERQMGLHGVDPGPRN